MGGVRAKNYFICRDIFGFFRALLVTRLFLIFFFSYTREVTKDGVKNQRKNPEVPVDLTRSSSILNEQMFALKALTNLLKNAYQGHDVEWDMEEVFHGGESSGVGPIAFSGDGSDDEDEDAAAPGGGSAQPPSVTVPSSAGPSAATTTTATPPGGNDGGTVVVKTATDDEDDVNVVDNEVDDGGSSATDSGSSRPSERALQKALAAYLLPVAAVWFGGSFLEWIL